MTETGAPPRVVIIIAAALAAALAAVVAVFGLLASSDGEQPTHTGPLPLVTVPAPQAGSSQCTSLVQAAPAELESGGALLLRRVLAEPAPPATVAWGNGDPVVLRCGLETPRELTPMTPLRQINGVSWLEVPGEGAATWYAVDRAVFVALTVPADAGTGPLQQISDTVDGTLPPVPVRFK
ncbi:DUF3515 domain-containing protein [Saccharomonospora sp. NPDC046836]|uniref:DUF3515 domain-containing protein n=1 Tax=Saccharomonospora sp. NPDC046836 TaxID=3156921 RepID=UPI0033D15056